MTADDLLTRLRGRLTNETMQAARLAMATTLTYTPARDQILDALRPEAEAIAREMASKAELVELFQGSLAKCQEIGDVIRIERDELKARIGCDMMICPYEERFKSAESSRVALQRLIEEWKVRAEAETHTSREHNQQAVAPAAPETA